ncbi:MAG: hypothetical protein NUV63_08220 [Gallionella sp.]|nr:hypothetical protein [Gallionella sp.]
MAAEHIPGRFARDNTYCDFFLRHEKTFTLETAIDPRKTRKTRTNRYVAVIIDPARIEITFRSA